MIDFVNKKVFKLKQHPGYGERVQDLLIEGETILDSFKSMRDGIVFTNKRIIALNVQGVTGKKKDYTSIPYNKISAYSVETSGTFDLDSELEIYVSGLGSRMRFEFKGQVDIIGISQYISYIALG